MTDKTTVKVGDVVAWDEVPSGAMVRDEEGDIAIRIENQGSWVKGPVTGGRIYGWRPDFYWLEVDMSTEQFTVLATMLTGDESGGELCGMVMRYDREHPAT
jgi:hypothetical protein